MMKVKRTQLTQKRSGLIDMSTKLETLKQFSNQNNYNNFMTFAGGSYVFLGVVDGGRGRQSRNLRVYQLVTRHVPTWEATKG